MAEIYRYIETSGLILPDTADLKEAVEGEFKAAFGQDLVVTPESPEGVLIGVETEARDAVVRNNAELANQINPDHAGGVFLDAIAALTGLEREKERRSMVPALLAGVPGTIVPAGARARTNAGDVFFSAERVVLGSAGTAAVLFLANEYGPVPAPMGSLATLVDPPLGLETVTNAAPASLGQVRESDASFRKKRDDTLFLQGVALGGAIQSAVRNVPGVKSLAFRENYSHEEQVIDNVAIPPHCIYVVVDGGADEDVARALFENKSLGCNWKGEVEVRVQDTESGQWYTVRFDRPEYVQVRAAFTVRVLGSVTVDYQTIVRQAVQDYAEDLLEGLRGFRVGVAVSPFEMSVAVGTVEPSIFVLRALVGPVAASPADLTPETMPLEIWQKAVITQASIDVVAG